MCLIGGFRTWIPYKICGVLYGSFFVFSNFYRLYLQSDEASAKVVNWTYHNGITILFQLTNFMSYMKFNYHGQS